MAPPSTRSVDVAGPNSLQNTKNATSISELISTIPQTWRPTLGDALNATYRVATKLCNTQNTIAQYERHKLEGSFPSAIRNSVKDPKLQFSKEFLGTNEGQASAGIIKAQIEGTRKELLNSALALKLQELAALQKSIKYDVVAWRKLVGSVAERAAIVLSADVAIDAESKTPPSWSKSPAASHIKQDCDLLWNHGEVFHYRAIALARSIADKSLVEKVKNLNLKTETDHAKMDLDVEVTTRDVIREELQAQMRLLKKDLAQQSKQTKKPATKKPTKKGGSKPQKKGKVVKTPGKKRK